MRWLLLIPFSACAADHVERKDPPTHAAISDGPGITGVPAAIQQAMNTATGCSEAAKGIPTSDGRWTVTECHKMMMCRVDEAGIGSCITMAAEGERFEQQAVRKR